MDVSTSVAAIVRLAAGVVVTSVVCAAAPLASQGAVIPDLAPEADALWIPDRPAGDDFLPPESGPGPVTADRAHAYTPLDQAQGQLMFHVADIGNPILQPWAAAEMKKANDDVLAGKFPYTARDRCWPGGVPGFDVYERDRPIYFLQMPQEVMIVTEYDQQVRHIRMNVAHSAHPKPSWYGESVGHYEGQTLVVDTIGMNDRTFVDNYRTPHTAQLHVVERFTLMDGGKILQATIAVDDPGAFTTRWSAMQRWKRRDGRPLVEVVCAENSASYFNYDVKPIPTAAKPDF